MRYSKSPHLLLAILLIFGCKSDDNGDREPQPLLTSFSGMVLYESNGEPVRSGELFISGTDSEPLRSPITRAEAQLKIEDGSFEISFETIEEVDRFTFAIDILENGFIINSFGWADGLQCLPGDCREFAPGKDYELTIVVPCAPDDCTRFTPQN